MIKSLGRGEDPHKAPSSITDNIHFSPSEIVSHKDASDINPIQSNPEWTVWVCISQIQFARWKLHSSIWTLDPIWIIIQYIAPISLVM